MTSEEMDRIDRLLAINLMKWKIFKTPLSSLESYIKNDSLGDEIVFFDIADWSPTRNISQAFEVITQLENLGAEVIIYKTKTMIFLNGLWHEGLGKVRQEHMMRAALAALGLKIKGD